MTRRFFTSESVAVGHPDKAADQVSDAILDAILRRDKNARVDAETVIMQGNVLVTGQITTKTYVDIPAIVRKVLKEIGFDNARDGLDWKTCGIVASIEQQSPDIARGVRQKGARKIGAGDQGIQWGAAFAETPELMPMPIMLAHAIVRRLKDVREQKVLPYLRPDGKSQVTVEYDDGVPRRVDAVVVAAQHAEGVPLRKVRKDIIEKVIKAAIPKEMVDSRTRFYVNGTGRFVIGGTLADSGLTGRKTAVDTYGGMAPHAGGCLSGKDPTKVDRSGQYMARYAAKNVVAAGLAETCIVQIAYVIGHPEPVSIQVDTQGTGKVPDEVILQAIQKVFDFRPGMIIRNLKLLRPVYRKTAYFGHFGRKEFTWERTDRTSALKKAVKELTGAKN